PCCYTNGVFTGPAEELRADKQGRIRRPYPLIIVHGPSILDDFAVHVVSSKRQWYTEPPVRRLILIEELRFIPRADDLGLREDGFSSEESPLCRRGIRRTSIVDRAYLENLLIQVVAGIESDCETGQVRPFPVSHCRVALE